MVIMSHLGRPEGVPNMKYSLGPVVPALSDLLKTNVDFMEMQHAVDNKCAALQDTSKVVLLENLRFNVAETGKGVVDGKKVKAT